MFIFSSLDMEWLFSPRVTDATMSWTCVLVEEGWEFGGHERETRSCNYCVVNVDNFAGESMFLFPSPGIFFLSLSGTLASHPLMKKKKKRDVHHNEEKEDNDNDEDKNYRLSSKRCNIFRVELTVFQWK